MKKGIKDKKAIFAIGALALIIALVGGVVAVNHNMVLFNNRFNLATFQTEVSETFDSPNDWKPCDETQKLVTVRNTGNIDALVRIKMDEHWLSKNDEELGLVYHGVTLAQISFANNDWELRDGYYYYKNTLRAGESTDFISAVTFSCDADFGENEMVGGNGAVVDSTANEYNGASYHLNIVAQLMQDDPDISWDDVFEEWKQPESFALLKSGFPDRFKDEVVRERDLLIFKRSKVLPNASTVESMTEMQADGETPIYMWYVPMQKAVYWYSAADAITYNRSDQFAGVFNGLLFAQKLSDASGLEYFDMKNVTNMNGVFYGDNIPDDLSAMAHWDVSGVTSYGGVFAGVYSNGDYIFGEKYYPAIKYWNVSGAKYLSGMMGSNPNIENLEAFKNWRPENALGLQGAFSGLSNLKSLKGLEDWNMPNLTGLDQAFMNCTQLTDISAIKNWNVANVTSFKWMFKNTAVSDATMLNGWAVSNSAVLTEMFVGPNYTEASYPTWYTAERRS